jgi:hypothetical protein
MSNFGFLEDDARDGAVALIAEICEDNIFRMCKVLKFYYMSLVFISA